MKHLVLVALVMTAACVELPLEPSDPGDPADPAGGGGGSLPPPGGGGGGDGSGMTACSQVATPPGTGHHNAGANCLGCHTGTSAAPLWTAAGTLYSSSGAPLVGATIKLVDASGKSISIVTAQNGNFWTSEPVKTPLQVKASLCPSTAAMNGGASGACNSCHTSTGSPGRITLP